MDLNIVLAIQLLNKIPFYLVKAKSFCAIPDSNAVLLIVLTILRYLSAASPFFIIRLSFRINDNIWLF